MPFNTIPLSMTLSFFMIAITLIILIIFLMCKIWTERFPFEIPKQENPQEELERDEKEERSKMEYEEGRKREKEKKRNENEERKMEKEGMKDEGMGGEKEEKGEEKIENKEYKERLERERLKRLKMDNGKKVVDFWDFFKYFVPLIIFFEKKFWLMQLSLDGYSYLYYQRKIISLLLILSLILIFHMNLHPLLHSLMRDQPEYSQERLILQMTCDIYQNYHPLLFLYLVTCLSIHQFTSIKLHMQKIYFNKFYRRTPKCFKHLNHKQSSSLPDNPLVSLEDNPRASFYMEAQPFSPSSPAFIENPLLPHSFPQSNLPAHPNSFHSPSSSISISPPPAFFPSHVSGSFSIPPHHSSIPQPHPFSVSPPSNSPLPSSSIPISPTGIKLRSTLPSACPDCCRFEEYEVNLLKLRTVQIKGVDGLGLKLSEFIQEFLRKENCQDEILDCLIVQDYSELLGLEKKRLLLKDLENIYEAEESIKTTFLRCIIPRKLLIFKENFEKNYDDLDEEIEEAIERPIKPTGYCFMCFSTLEAMEKCRTYFNSSSIRNNIRAFLMDIKLFFTKSPISSPSPLLLSRKKSTFGRYQYSSENEKFKYPMIQHCPNPLDIHWININNTSPSLLILRRLALMLLIFSLIVFFTTPTVIFQMILNSKILDWKWTENMPRPFGGIIKLLLPSLFVSLTNQIILLIIDYSCELKRSSQFSGYQISILKNTVFYMLLNIVIMPLFAFETSVSLYENLTSSNTISLSSFFRKEDGLEKSAKFFLLILINQSVLGYFCYALRLQDLIFSFFKVFLAYYKRIYLNSGPGWRKENDDIFQYGYYSAQNITNLAIVFLYLNNEFAILCGGLLFFISKHLLDAWNLASFFQKELHSHGALIQGMLKLSFIPLFLFQFITIYRLILDFNLFKILLAGALIGVSLIILIFMDGYICTIKNFGEGKKLGKVHMNKWRAAYQHPLVIPEENKGTEGEEEGAGARRRVGVGRRDEREGARKEARARDKGITNLENIDEY